MGEGRGLIKHSLFEDLKLGTPPPKRNRFLPQESSRMGTGKGGHLQGTGKNHLGGHKLKVEK